MLRHLPALASGSKKLVKELEEQSGKKGVELEIVKTGCQGLCQKGPVMNVEPHGFFYQKVRAEDAGDLLLIRFQPGNRCDPSLPAVDHD